jgi:drug/metabolite transporter superfamily protein YnfA
VSLEGLSPRLATWLRRGIVAVAALAILVSIYALAAILYRTAIDRLTPNRLAFIGWNIINIGLLILVLMYQLRTKEGRWLPQLHRAYSAGMVAYAIWTVMVILSLPWLFGFDQVKMENLPLTVQRALYERPAPVLLKCYQSPHIYLIEKGEKRWIDTIETFEDRGYTWSDVQFVPCVDLRNVPDGPTIPEGVGPPPQPFEQ